MSGCGSADGGMAPGLMAVAVKPDWHKEVTRVLAGSESQG